MRIVLAFAMLIAATPGAAQQVYKCTNAAGDPVYAQRPCSDDPDKVETVDTSRSLKTGSGPALPPTEVEQIAARAGQQVVCSQRESEIVARFDKEFPKLERQIADAKVRNPAQAVELTARREQMIRARDEELKKAASLCSKEMGQ